jgi:hypothetical protein
MKRRELTIVQAYARAANTNAKAAQKDWIDGKDFKILSGPYFSSRDRFQMYREGITRLCCVDRFCNQLFEIDLVAEARTQDEYGDLLPEDVIE